MDNLTRLILQTRGTAKVLQPLLPPKYAPARKLDAGLIEEESVSEASEVATPAAQPLSVVASQNQPTIPTEEPPGLQEARPKGERPDSAELSDEKTPRVIGGQSPSGPITLQMAATPLVADSESRQPPPAAAEILEVSDAGRPDHREEQKPSEPTTKPIQHERPRQTDQGQRSAVSDPGEALPAPVVRERSPGPPLPAQVPPRPSSDLRLGSLLVSQGNDDPFSIQITIGRVEVRAVQPKPEEPRQRPNRGPRSSLESYLQRRRRSGHE
jgi:hypothetical protein